MTLALWKTETLFSFLVSLWQNKLMWQESDAKTSTCRISGCRGALKISDIDGNQYCQSENEVGEFLGWSGIHSEALLIHLEKRSMWNQLLYHPVYPAD